jgi:rhodanese-related sulfurtransferase
MLTTLRHWMLSLTCALLTTGALGATDPAGRLVDVGWLQANLARVVLLDASVTAQHRAAHIPGAVSADLYRYGNQEPPRAAMEQRIRSWGVSGDRPVVIYDQGGDSMAPRLFFDLYYYGVPAERLHILDGGLSRWREQGGALSTAPTPAPEPGSFRITAVRDEVRVPVKATSWSTRWILSTTSGVRSSSTGAAMCPTRARCRFLTSTTPTRPSSRPATSAGICATWGSGPIRWC